MLLGESEEARLGLPVDGIPLSELSDARERALQQRGLGTSSGNRMRARPAG